MFYWVLYLLILVNFSPHVVNLETPTEGVEAYQNKMTDKYSRNIRRRRQSLSENDVGREISRFPENISGSNQGLLNFGEDEDALVYDYGDSDFRRPSTVSRQISPEQFSTTSSNLQENVPSEVIIPGMGTRRPVCEETCPSTPEYNPVCGDNNVTYPNLGKLQCASRCGRRVSLQFRGACLTRARG